ncbi:unnamed protein product, partial [Prorocentrum cordatum]
APLATPRTGGRGAARGASGRPGTRLARICEGARSIYRWILHMLCFSCRPPPRKGGGGWRILDLHRCGVHAL